jgi:hypothetical protein
MNLNFNNNNYTNINNNIINTQDIRNDSADNDIYSINNLSSINFNSNNINNSNSINSIDSNNSFISIEDINTIDSYITAGEEKRINNLSGDTSINWKIATQNLRGTSDIVKQRTWWDYCIKENLDIVFITETKTTKTSEKYIFFEQINSKENKLNPTYQLWWSSVAEAHNNNIGSGVGFMIKSTISKHVYKVDRFEGHGICILLSYRGKITFQMIGIYAPNKYSINNSQLGRLRTWLYNHISQALTNDWISIIMGDWNALLIQALTGFPTKRNVPQKVA